MPFLRVVRDKRGYETTYLIHSFREGPQQRSRVLYAFRSPGGVRVGRDAFEAEVRREIETRNPEISFDWDALMSARQVIDSTPEQRRPRRRPGGDTPAPAAPPPRRTEAPPAPRLVVPTVVEGDSAETRMRFLAHWHGILCEQLPVRVVDPARRELLLTLAQRLNPAGWIDADEIATGIQGATEALEQLSRILTKRRRKGRRGGQRDTSTASDVDRAGTDQANPLTAESPEVGAEEADVSGNGDSAGDEPDMA